MRLIQSSNNAKYTLILTKINFQEDIGKTAKRKSKEGLKSRPSYPFPLIIYYCSNSFLIA